jgi:hypothetical protein
MPVRASGCCRTPPPQSVQCRANRALAQQPAHHDEPTSLGASGLEDACKASPPPKKNTRRRAPSNQVPVCGLSIALGRRRQPTDGPDTHNACGWYNPRPPVPRASKRGARACLNARSIYACMRQRPAGSAPFFSRAASDEGPAPGVGSATLAADRGMTASAGITYSPWSCFESACEGAGGRTDSRKALHSSDRHTARGRMSGWPDR